MNKLFLRHRNRLSHPLFDLLVIVLAIIGLFILAGFIGIGRSLHELSLFSFWNLDVLSILLGLLALGFGVYARRRWSDLEKEVAERRRTEAALRMSELQHRQLLEATNRQAQELSLLNRVIAAAASPREATEVLSLVCEELTRTLHLPQAAAALLSEDGETLTVVAEYYDEGRPSAKGAVISVRNNPATRYVLTHRRPLVLSDAQTDPRQAAFQDLARTRGTVSLLIVPLVIRDKVVGTLGLDALENRYFSTEEIDLVMRVATAVGQALEKAFLYAELQRELNERKQVERLKDEFIATVSHELRTPLTSIRGALGLIAGGVTGELPAQTMAMIKIAQTNSDRLLRLINDILDIERIEANELILDLQPLNVIPLIDQAIAANRPYAQQLGVHVVLESSPSDVIVRADAERLIQVLNNLLANAAKFSPPDGVVLVRVTRHDSYARIAVADSGPGIPEEFRGRIFQKFAQADSSDTRQKGGTGLGLSIAKSLVERLGGRISYETSEGVGTTFYVDLPLIDASVSR